MNLQLLKMLYDYNYWAHRLVWNTSIVTLTDEQFAQELGYSWVSIHAQVVHVMSAEWIWFSRLHGISPTAMLQPSDYPNRKSIRRKWDEIEQQAQVYIAGLNEQALQENIHYGSTKGEKFTQKRGEILLHMVNHGTDHRAQILAMLHQLGAPTVEQDIIFYLRERQINQ